MAYYETQINGARPWANGSVSAGDTKEITVQTLNANGTTSGSTGGVVSNQDSPTAPNGIMTVSGHLIINMAYPISTVYFGYGSGTSGNYNAPWIKSGGVVDIYGYGTYNGSNFINFLNTTTNAGTINISNISMHTSDANSKISGAGTLNLTDVRLTGNNGNFNNCTIGSIIGGQTINMTGSDLSVYTALTDVRINMHGGGNYLALRPNITVRNVNISGFGQGDIIDIAYLNGADTWTYDPATGNLVVTSGNYFFKVNIGLGYDPDLFMATNTAYPGMQGLTYLAAAPCFLAGTLIEAEAGHIAVENLQPGDVLRCVSDGRKTCKRVKSVSKGSIAVTRASNLGPDEAGYSVRVCKNAFDDGKPFQDLLVTAEHRFLIDGKLVPIRTIVNGTSIRYEIGIKNYDYYHVDMDTHEIIIANGVPTESYDATKMEKGTSPVSEAAGNLAAPLETGRDFLEPLYARLSDRAEKLGFERPVAKNSMTASSMTAAATITLAMDDGTLIQPRSRSGRHYSFAIPEGARRTHIIAPTARPCDVIGPFHDDRRYLGALVGEIVLFGGTREHRIDTHLNTGSVAGWHRLERPDHRWTKGRALVDLPTGTERGPSVLVIEVLANMECSEDRPVVNLAKSA